MTLGGAGLGEIAIAVVADTRPLDAGFNDAKRKAESAGQAISGGFKKGDAGAKSLANTIQKDVVGGIAKMGASLIAFNTLQNAIRGVHEATQQQAQAQFALNKLYGESAGEFTKFANQLGTAINKQGREVQQAAVLFNTLRENYGFTDEQIKVLIQRSADLAAVSGKDLVDAAQRVQSAMRGEGEAAEVLGLTLNSDAVKAMANMTAEQRKNFETLDQASKARIIYNEFLRQSATAEGAATERATEGLGVYDRLGKSLDTLALTIGQVVGPTSQALAENLTRAAEAATNLIKLTQVLTDTESENAKVKAIQAQVHASFGGKVIAGVQQLGQLVFGEQQVAHAAEEHTEAQKELGQAIQETTREAEKQNRALQIAEQAQRKAAEKTRLEARKEVVERVASANIAALRAEQKAADEGFDQRRARLQVLKAEELAAAEARRDAALSGIAAEEQASQDAFAAQRARLQNQKNAAIRSAEARRDAAIRAIEQEQQAFEDATQERITALRIEKDEALQAIAERRDQNLDALKEEQQALKDARQGEDFERSRAREFEDRGRRAQHEALVEAIHSEKDAVKERGAAERAEIERTRDAALRAIDQRADVARDAHDEQIEQLAEQLQKEQDKHSRAIENLRDRQREEDKRHREAMRHLDREEARALGEVQAELDALDKLEQKERRQERDARLAARLAEAQAGLEVATLAGDPEALLEAQQKVADAELEIQKTRIKDERDAERERLRERLDEIRQAFDQRRDQQKRELEAVKDRIDQEIRSENARFEEFKRRVANERAISQDNLQAELKALETEKLAAKDTATARIEAVNQRMAADLAALEERERLAQAEFQAESERIKDLRAEQDFALQQQRQEEDRAYGERAELIRGAYEEERAEITRTYDDPIEGLIPKQQQALEEARRTFGERKTEATALYEAERFQITETYDNPETGLFAKLRAVETESQRVYANRKADVQAVYQAEKDEITATYDHPETGLFKKLSDAEKKTKEELDKQIDHWEQWGKDSRKEIDETIKKLDELYSKMNNPPQRVGDWDPFGSPSGGAGGGPGTIPQPAPPGPIVGRSADVPPGVVILDALKSPASYVTDQGTHAPFPAADIFAPRGAPIYAPTSGRMSTISSKYGGYGAVLSGSDGLFYYFAHANRAMRSGTVGQGEIIGQVGNTGAEGTHPHLHYAIASDSHFSRGHRGGSGNVWPSQNSWRVSAFADGGLIPEPTLLVSLRDMQPYALAGEAGIEHVVPERDMVGAGRTNYWSISGIGMGDVLREIQAHERREALLSEDWR